jgi:predicted MFS family arabinose efflux permease
VFGVGWSASSLVPVTTIVTRWFVHRRAMAIAVVSSGLSVGGVVLTPLAAWLLDTRGLAGGMPLLGLAFVVGIVPITLAFVRDDPARLGLSVEGAAPAGPARSAAGAVASVAAAVRSRFFLWSTAAYLLIMLAQGGGIGHLFELAGERTDDATAAVAVSILAGTSVVARLVGGWLATRRSVRRLTIGLCALQCASLVLLSQAADRFGLVAGAVLFGVTVGNLPVLQPLLIIEAFGVGRYAEIFARAQVPTTVGLAIGPVVLGLVHDATGGYAGSYLLAATAAAGAGVLMATLAGPTTAAGGRPAVEEP